MTTETQTLRKHTRFTHCPTHEAFFAGERRQRVAEFYVEGGPASGPACTDEGCRMRPGTDLFVASFVEAEQNWSALAEWDCNR